MPKKSDLERFNPNNKFYLKLLETAKHKIISTRIRVTKAVCREQMSLYWWFGQQIIKAQEKHGWGKSVVEQLSMDLKRVFNGISLGFSPQNLWYMRQFYIEYKDYPNLQQLVGEIGWGQNILILSKIKDIKARQY